MSTPSPTLSSDAIDDLIYDARTDDLESLRSSISSLSSSLNITASQIISQTIDIDADGLGSRASLLHYPAANGRVEMLRYLLDTLNETSPNTAAGAQSTESNSETLRSVNSAATSRLVNHQNVSGNTPLHWAALNGHLEVVKLLVGAGADPTVVNEAGRDAVVEAEYSAQKGAEECAVWLLKECEVLERGAGGVGGDADADVDAEGDEIVDGEEEEAKAANGLGAGEKKDEKEET